MRSGDVYSQQVPQSVQSARHAWQDAAAATGSSVMCSAPLGRSGPARQNQPR